MIDVAALAGVSHQTVSRVLNGHHGVRPETRARVLAAMEALAYRPNLAARTLVTGRSRVIGVVTLGCQLFGPMSILSGVERAARTVNYSVRVATCRGASRSELRAAVERLVSQGVDGVIVLTPLHVDDLAGLAMELPLVVVGALPKAGVPVVAGDQAAGARLATEHLLGLGHRTVWHVAGPDGWFESALRIEGWRAALAAACAPEPHLLAGDWSACGGYQAGLRLAHEPGVTAVLAANDQTALGVLRAFAEHGRRVPHDVSIVGFDDTPESAYFNPPLTTVRQDYEELGRRALVRLRESIGGGSPTAERIVLTPTLVVRSSTALPPP